MMWKNSLMAYEEDIRKSGSWFDWLKALHRYEGILELTSSELVFNGRDVKEDKEFQLKIPLRNIVEMSYGFEDPLRIRYHSESGEKTIYLFAHLHHKKGIRTSDNREVYEKLKERIEQILHELATRPPRYSNNSG